MSQLAQYRAARALINDYHMRKRASLFLDSVKQRANVVANYIKDIDWTGDRAKRVYSALGTAGIGGVTGALLGGRKGAVLGALGGAGLGYGGMYGYQRFLRTLVNEAKDKNPNALPEVVEQAH